MQSIFSFRLFFLKKELQKMKYSNKNAFSPFRQKNEGSKFKVVENCLQGFELKNLKFEH
jgi:hypothetical protein